MQYGNIPNTNIFFLRITHITLSKIIENSIKN